MLRHAAWQRRIRWFHLAAEKWHSSCFYCGSICGGDSSPGADDDGSGSSSDFDGRVFVGFFQLLLVCVSLLLAACIEAPGSSAAAAARQRCRRSHGDAAVGCAMAAVQRVRDGFAEGERLVSTLCAVLSGQAFPGVIQLASWLLLLSFLWTLAVVLEQPGLALPSPPPLLPPLLSA